MDMTARAAPRQSPDPQQAWLDVRDAVDLLRQARDLLAGAGAKRAADKARLALSSAKGALRHADNKSSAALLAACQETA